MTCCLGFLRAGEMTVPSDFEYDPGIHLSMRDVALDSSLIWVTIKQSKTDLFKQGMDLFVGNVQARRAWIFLLGRQKRTCIRWPTSYIGIRGTKDWIFILQLCCTCTAISGDGVLMPF